jgi:non-ribosomal peptide synthetase-like protein
MAHNSGAAGGARPTSRRREDGLVLTCAGHDNSVHWRPGERLEHLFEARAAELGDTATAVDGPSGSLTYGELDARANQLARFLALRAGLRSGDRVGLLFDRSLDGYVAMLAVLKLHAAYVPLDGGFPADRLAYVASDAGARIVLTASRLRPLLAEVADGVEVLALDEAEIQIAGERAEPLGAGEVPEPVDDLCYVIYTSGTTGRPKGVAVRHPSIVNFVRVASEVYGVGSDDRVYQGMTIAFDFSVEEIWTTWLAGATLVPKPDSAPLLGAELHEFLTEQRVSALCCVPTLLSTIEDELPGLRFLLVSGESCPEHLVDRWSRPGRRFLNVYGPTEATVSATWTLLDASRPVTIGVPLPTYSAVVLDLHEERALPAGELGELGIAGIGLADGYLGRPEVTERAFIPDFLSMPENPSGRIYRTGDLVRVNDDGEIEHHGRIDTQVKIRGYRIEAAEIEAVLGELPGVAQAVVDVYEPVPGAKELVAYYTARSPLDPSEIYDALRRRLPAYMVPSYLEQIDELPLLPSGKLDRRQLPGPTGPRHLTPQAPHVGPSSPLEAVLSEGLAAVLGIERVSVVSDFFDDLGANSLLMTRFVARLRSSELAVSVKDVYLHPSVRRLASAVAAGESPDRREGAPAWEEPAPPVPVGKPRYVLCGALQLLAFLAVVCLAAYGLDVAARWLFAAHGILEIYVRAVGAGAGLLLGEGLLQVAAKWLLVGRFKPGAIRVWSLAYFRFWIVKTLIVYNPLPRLLVGTPLYALYLRALGARVSTRSVIFSQHVPVCTDMLSVGADSVIYKGAFLNGYRVRAGAIEIGPVEIGWNAFVGEAAVIDIHTTVGDDAQLGHSSSLHAGQAVPAGECWHGSPAQPAPAEYDYRTVAPMTRGRLRAIRFSVGRMLALVAIAGPLEVAIGILLLTHPRWVEHLGLLAAPLAAGVGLLGLVLVSLLVAVGVPRLLSWTLCPGRVYPLYGLHYRLQRVISRASNNSLLTGLFGDSCAIVHYLRAIGYRFGVIEQTGSNFGLDVRQELPSLTHIGTGTIVSDGLSLMNAEFSSTSFRVMPVRLGNHNYVGNAISYPAGGRTGDDCLFATKAMIPIAGPVREHVGLLGSPCFEIPRSVLRDQRFDAISTGAERRRRLRAKTRHNVVTMALHLLVDYVVLLGLFAVALAPLGGRGAGRLAGTVASTLAELALMIAVFVFAERAVTGFRALVPRYCSIYQREFWAHERFWKVAPTGYARLLDGTPFKALLWRLLGVRIGRRVFDDGLAITERTLVQIGDRATFGMGATLQSHTLEDGAFKSDHIVVGSDCTIGVAALVNYGVRIEDGAEIGTDAFVMKGSLVRPGERWRGNPASDVRPAEEAVEGKCERELQAA